jgi:hypothetical protein
MIIGIWDMGFETMIYIYTYIYIYIYMIYMIYYIIYISDILWLFSECHETLNFCWILGFENRTDIKLQKLLTMTNIWSVTGWKLLQERCRSRSGSSIPSESEEQKRLSQLQHLGLFINMVGFQHVERFSLCKWYPPNLKTLVFSFLGWY